MRNIKKKITVRDVECNFYDRTAKAERTEKYTIPETMERPAHPENWVLLDMRVLSEREAVYTMTAVDFIAHATLEPAAQAEPAETPAQ